MDVEKLKKINKLSVELRKHGMADSHDDAISKASESIRDEDLKEVLAQTRTNSEEKVLPGFDKQYQIMLERQNRQLAEEICKLKEVIAQIKEEIAQLKCGSVRMPAAEPKQEKQATLQNKQSSHPRQGNYKSEDVAVDKIFYFGKK